MLALLKILISALLIFVISEVSKRTGFLGALIASIPAVSVISIFWLYYETGDVGRISAFSRNVFWLVLPSLGFFAVLPVCLKKLGFIPSVFVSTLVTILLYALLLWILPKVGLKSD